MPTTTVVYTNRPDSVSGPLSLRRGGVSRFVLPDLQGHARQLTDSTGAVTDTLTADAWGVQKATSGATVNPYQAFGQWGYFTDTPSRLYVRARHLRVDQGRWVSRDPLHIRSSDESPYVYVRGHVVGFVDPSGLQCADCCEQEKDYWNSLLVLRHCMWPNGAWDDCPKVNIVKKRCTKVMWTDKDCKRLMEDYKRFMSQCNVMCDQPGGGIYTNPYERAIGAVHCCQQADGKWKFCDGPKCCNKEPTVLNWKNDKVAACTLACILDHEELHIKECDKGLPPHECCAYAGTVECMEELRVINCPKEPKPPGFETCRQKAAPKNCKDRYK